jgi:hypothetical protein
MDTNSDEVEKSKSPSTSVLEIEIRDSVSDPNHEEELRRKAEEEWNEVEKTQDGTCNSVENSYFTKIEF